MQNDRSCTQEYKVSERKKELSFELEFEFGLGSKKMPSKDEIKVGGWSSALMFDSMPCYDIVAHDFW